MYQIQPTTKVVIDCVCKFDQSQTRSDAFLNHEEATKTHMSLPQPPKLVLDDFINTALGATPPELHPFFESFRSLYTRKSVLSLISPSIV